MKINVEELKTLVEAGDESAIQAHIFASLEKGDIKTAAEANKEILSEVDSIKDTHHQTALETFKKNQVPKLIQVAVDEKVKELNPTETPEQKQIRELTEMFAKEKQKSARAEIRAKLVELATGDEIGLDSAFITKHIDKYVPATFEVGEDGEIDTSSIIENVKADLTGFATDFKAVVSAQVEQTMKGTARSDVGGGTGGGSKQEKTLGEKLALQNQHASAEEDQGQFFK